MVTVPELLAGVLLPLLVAAGVVFLAAKATRPALGMGESRSRFAPLAVGLAFVVGWLALFGWRTPANDATNWLFFVALPLVGLAMLGWSLLDWPQVRLLVAIVGVSISWLLLAWSRLPMKDPGTDFGWGQFLAIVLAGIVWVVVMGELARHTTARRMSLILLAAYVPAGIALTVADSLRMGQIAGLLIAAQLGVLAVNLCWGRAGQARGMVVVGTLFGGLLLAEYLYSFSELRTKIALLCFAAPALAAAIAPLERRLGTLWTGLLQILVVLLLAVVPAALAIADFVRSEQAY